MMLQGKKRSLDEGSSSLDGYVLSLEEHRALMECSRNRSMFSYFQRRPPLPFNFDADDHKLDQWDLDMGTKKGILKVAPSVVSLVSFSGSVIVSQACGTIIEAEDNVNTVMTCLNLVRKPTKSQMLDNTLAKSLKIIVRSSDDKSYIGDIYAYDFHYNLLIIKFKSATSLKIAKLRMFNEEHAQGQPFLLRPHSVKVKAGDCVVVAGRYFYEPYNFMVASGTLSRHRPSLDLYGNGCLELLLAECSISKCGDGAPVVNVAGEVIGMSFYEISSCSPFLPVDVAYKWWNHYKTFKEHRHPSYGFQVIDMYSANWATLERVVKEFPDISDGVLVDMVLPGSNAVSADLRENDIITKCDGKSVQSFLQLWNIMWGKVGDAVQLEVVRVGLSSVLSIDMAVSEAAPDHLYTWPRYEYR